MASVFVVGIIAIIAGIIVGAFFLLSLAIGWEDRRRGSLGLDAPSPSTKVARSLVGITGIREE